MRSYQDKTTGLWKWGTNGKPEHKTKIECDSFGLSLLTDKLRYIRDKLNTAAMDHGVQRN